MTNAVATHVLAVLRGTSLTQTEADEIIALVKSRARA